MPPLTARPVSWTLKRARKWGLSEVMRRLCTRYVRSLIHLHAQVCFSGDNERVASGCLCVARVNVRDAHPASRTCAVNLSVSFSADGLSIVSGSFDRTVRVWDSWSGDLFSELVGHVKYVSSVSFSKDGHEVVSGSGDRSVKVWSAIGGEGAGSSAAVERQQSSGKRIRCAVSCPDPSSRS